MPIDLVGRIHIFCSLPKSVVTLIRIRSRDSFGNYLYAVVERVLLGSSKFDFSFFSNPSPQKKNILTEKIGMSFEMIKMINWYQKCLFEKINLFHVEGDTKLQNLLPPSVLRREAPACGPLWTHVCFTNFSIRTPGVSLAVCSVFRCIDLTNGPSLAYVYISVQH